jgi:acyl carrier protein
MRALSDAKLGDPSSRAASSGDSDDSSGGSATAKLRRQFQTALASSEDPAEAVAVAVGAIAATVAQMVFVDVMQVSTARSVAHYGVDSLIAAELRHWFRAAFDSDVSMLELLDAGRSMEDLAKALVRNALKARGE